MSALETAFDHPANDLRDIYLDLYPEAQIRGNRTAAVWRGGDNPNSVSIKAHSLRDFKTKKYNVWEFLTEIAGLSKIEAAHYLLARAGLGDTPVTPKAARRTKSRKHQDADAERYKARALAAAAEVQRTAPTTGSSAYFTRKGITDLFKTHRVAPGKLPSGETVPGLVYSQDEDGPFVQLVLRDLEGNVTGYQRLYDGERGKWFVFGTKAAAAFVLLEPNGETLPKSPDALAAKLAAPKNPAELAICEGFATGASVALARPLAFVFCALSAGNLGPVAQAIRGRYGYRRRFGRKQKAVAVCVWADADPVGQEKAHGAALDAFCSVRTPKAKGCSDFNDLHQALGLEAVGRTRKVNPDAAQAFAKDLAKQRPYLNAEKYLPAFDLPQHGAALIVRAPMETGKTHQLGAALKRAQAANLRVLVVVHRESLADSLAERLGLENYNDYAASELRHVNRGLVICFDSLHKLAIGGALPGYDLLILDECEQVLRHLIGTHIKHKKASFDALTHYLNDAPRFIGLDAHAGALTLGTLRRFAPRKTVNWHRHAHHVGKGRTARFVYDRDDALDALLESTTPTFYASDSLKRTRDLHAYLGDAATLTINSETTATPAVKAYFKDPTKTAPNYQRLIVSPSGNTGLSDDSGRWPHVVGDFTGVGTPQDAAQSLRRARGAPLLTIYANPARRTRKTQGEFLAAAEAADRAEAELSGKAAPNRDPAYFAHKTSVQAHESAQRANYRRTLIRDQTLDGYEVKVELPTDLTAAKLEHRRRRREALHEAGMQRYVADRLAAEQLDAERAEVLRNKHRLTQAEQFALEAFDLRAFYMLPEGAPDTALAELLERDEYGKLREQVRRYEGFIEPEAVTQARAELQNEAAPLEGDRKHPLLRRAFYRRLGEIVGLNAETEGAVLEWEKRRAALDAEITKLGAERPGATTQRKGQLDVQLAQLHRTRNAHDAATLAASYNANDPEVRRFTRWVLDNYAALSLAVGNLPTREQLQGGRIMAHIGSWLRNAGLEQVSRKKHRGREYTVRVFSVATMRGLSLPRRQNWTARHYFSTDKPLDEIVPRPPKIASVTAQASPPPNPKPPLITAGDLPALLEQGRLDAFGPQKVAVIRRNVEAGRTDWLRQLATSRALGQVLGAL